MERFQIKLAEDKTDVLTAQRLRYEVFNLELKRGLASSEGLGLDQDEFDPLCDHILIIDREKNLTVGTYRLLLRSRLKTDQRFYSEHEFDLSNIKKLEGEILEMGRSCVHKDYRDNAILQLLWQSIIAYVTKHDVRYIIGCASVYTIDPVKISKIYALLLKNHFAPPAMRVVPQEGLQMQDFQDRIDIKGQERQIFLMLPSLVRSYLKTGAWACGLPAVDKMFGTVDFFLLLDTANFSQEHLKRMNVKKSDR